MNVGRFSSSRMRGSCPRPEKRLEQAGYKVVALADNGEDAIRNAGTKLGRL